MRRLMTLALLLAACGGSDGSSAGGEGGSGWSQQPADRCYEVMVAPETDYKRRIEVCAPEGWDLPLICWWDQETARCASEEGRQQGCVHLEDSRFGTKGEQTHGCYAPSETWPDCFASHIDNPACCEASEPEQFEQTWNCAD